MTEGFRALLLAVAISLITAVTVILIVGGPNGQSYQRRYSASEPEHKQTDAQQFRMPRIQETPSEKLKDNPKDKSTTDKNNMRDIMETATLIVGVIVASIYAFQAYLMRETMIHANRAYIHIGLWEKHPLLDEHGAISRWRIAPQIINAGSTPTRNLRYSSTNMVSNAELPPGFRFKSVGSERFTIVGPNQMFLGGDIILRVDDLIKTQSNKVWFYIFGWIEYDDVFFLTKRHRTEFCYRIFPYGNPMEKDCDFGYLFHTDYNGADDECESQRRKREAIPEPTPLRNEERQLSAGDITPVTAEADSDARTS